MGEDHRGGDPSSSQGQPQGVALPPPSQLSQKPQRVCEFLPHPHPPMDLIPSVSLGDFPFSSVHPHATALVQGTISLHLGPEGFSLLFATQQPGKSFIKGTSHPLQEGLRWLPVPCSSLTWHTRPLRLWPSNSLPYVPCTPATHFILTPCSLTFAPPCLCTLSSLCLGCLPQLLLSA